MPRRLVISADGSWNEPELHTSTKVVKLASGMLPSGPQGVVQVVCYHDGVGERGGFWDHLLDGAFGVGISANIEHLSLFLPKNHSPGDELFFLGLSRGVYTVPSLAGVIRNSGVLKRACLDRYAEAYEFHRDRTPDPEPSAARLTAFRAAYSWQAFNLCFIEIWDTVGACGIPVQPLRFWTKTSCECHDVGLSRSVECAHHALAIDERRKPFRPAIWVQHPQAPTTQRVEQAWFPGVHFDVVGAYHRTGLSDGAAAWLWRRTQTSGPALSGSARPRANPTGPCGESMTLSYGIFGNGARATPCATGLHASTIARQKSDSSYALPNVATYLGNCPRGPIFTP